MKKDPHVFIATLRHKIIPKGKVSSKETTGQTTSKYVKKVQLGKIVETDKCASLPPFHNDSGLLKFLSGPFLIRGTYKPLIKCVDGGGSKVSP